MVARKLNPDELAALAPLEDGLRSAANAGWMRWPGRAAVETALRVWEAAYGASYKLNTGCGRCVRNLFADLGRMYFSQKGAPAGKAASKPGTRGKEVRHGR